MAGQHEPLLDTRRNCWPRRAWNFRSGRAVRSTHAHARTRTHRSATTRATPAGGGGVGRCRSMHHLTAPLHHPYRPCSATPHHTTPPHPTPHRTLCCIAGDDCDTKICSDAQKNSDRFGWIQNCNITHGHCTELIQTTCPALKLLLQVTTATSRESVVV